MQILLVIGAGEGTQRLKAIRILSRTPEYSFKTSGLYIIFQFGSLHHRFAQKFLPRVGEPIYLQRSADSTH